MKQREIFIEQNENITDKKAFHSENSIIHLITANNAKIKKKEDRVSKAHQDLN